MATLGADGGAWTGIAMEGGVAGILGWTVMGLVGFWVAGKWVKAKALTRKTANGLYFIVFFSMGIQTLSNWV